MTLAQTTQADMNWFAVLAHHASRTPDKTITVFEGVATTYGEMADRAAALGGGLSERGVGRGDVVALLSYNCPEILGNDLRRQLPRSYRDADQLAPRRSGGAVHP